MKNFLLLLLLTATAASAQPYTPQLQMEPPSPSSAQPITLQFKTWCMVSSTPNPEVVRIGNLLRVNADSAGCILVYPPDQDPPIKIDLGRLEAGSYTIELWLRGVGRKASFPLTVSPAIARLRQNRFELKATWLTAAGETGPAQLVQEPSEDSALFYFFNRGNWELMVKVLDGCAINGHYWVFAAASTDLAYDVAVKDLETGRLFSFDNPAGTPAAAVTAVEAFPCD